MAYQLLFKPEARAFELVVPRGDWDRLSGFHPESEETRNFLKEDAAWERGPERIGFAGCGAVREEWGRVRIVFPIERCNLPRTLLTLDFLLENLNRFRDAPDGFYTVENACGQRLSVHGRVSDELRKKLGRVPVSVRQSVLEHMRQAHKACAPQNLADYDDDCSLIVYEDERRFVLGCIGNACDVAIYPDAVDGHRGHTPFSCHNLDAPFQQAILLAGFCTLAELLREMK